MTHAHGPKLLVRFLLVSRKLAAPHTQMIIRISLGIIGGLCMILGFIGLVVPLMPGFIFFAIGTLCLASASPFIARQLAKQPRLGRFLARLETAKDLPLTTRAKVTLWAAAEIFVDKKRA